MKRILIAAGALFIMSQSFAQKADEITGKNSWLKAGIEASVPVGNISDYSSFAAGIDISGQFMQTRHFGIGLTTGYTQFFGKDGADGFGTIPLGLMLRYYPMHEGIFVGADLGYTFITNTDGTNGGFYIKPQVGYHNYDWNFFGFYNEVFTGSGNIDVQNIGVAATYNIHFK